MNKSGFILIIFFLLQFALITPCSSATDKRTVKFNLTLKQARGGDSKAMFLVARMYENAKGTKKNISEASKWYQRSASQNYPAANARLGKLYLEGIGVKKNTKKAFSLLNLAAIQGIPAAQFNLAILYELGIGTTKDLQEAIKWYDFATKGGYYTAKSKSNKLKAKLGINNNSTAVVTAPAPGSLGTEFQNTTLDGIDDTDVEEQFTENDPDTLTEPDFTEEGPTTDLENSSPTPENKPTVANNPESEEQALLGNTFDREEVEPKNISIQNFQMNKEQKLALITDQNIKRTLKTLLDGRWFDKNRPVNFLPSPKTSCHIINQSDIKCTSRQLQRNTGKETIYYKTLTKITKFTSKGSFLIRYQNTVVRVVADKVVNEDGVLYQSKIKEGLQQLIHELTCQYQNISNLVCVKDNATIYNFKNRAIAEKNQDETQ